MASLSPFTGVLGLKNAAHLLRRASFLATKIEIDQFALKTVDEAYAELTIVQDIPEKPIDPETGLTWLTPKAENIDLEKIFLLTRYTIAWHLEQIRKSPPNLTERMVWFYHTHLPVQRSIVDNSESIFYQNALYRFFAFGNFKDLMTKVTIDNAMLEYIDNHLNSSHSPNENYAREFMELYTIGKGPQIGPDDYTNYTEHDVQQAARVLSGYGVDSDYTTIDDLTGIPRGKVYLDNDGRATRHDAQPKTFSSKFNETVIEPNELLEGLATEEATLDELDQFVTMIFTQEETSRFICRKIYRHFVHYKITEEIETDIIEALAQTFREANFEIMPVMEQLLKSQHFYDIGNSATSENIMGAMIKSPLEIVMNIFRFFKLEMPTDYYPTYLPGLFSSFYVQGLDLYEPIDVAGFPAYHQVPTYNRYWITPNNLPNRYKFAEDLIKGVFTDIKLDVVAYAENTENITNPADADVLLNELTDYIFPQELPEERRDYFMNTLLDTLTKDHWETEWNNYISTNDDTVVRSQLEMLFISLLQTPEFQLM